MLVDVQPAYQAAQATGVGSPTFIPSIMSALSQYGLPGVGGLIVLDKVLGKFGIKLT